MILNSIVQMSEVNYWASQKTSVQSIILETFSLKSTGMACFTRTLDCQMQICQNFRDIKLMHKMITLLTVDNLGHTISWLDVFL